MSNTGSRIRPRLAQLSQNEVKRKLGWREHYGYAGWRPCEAKPEDVGWGQ
jgi:hypothetical protein